MALKKFSLPEKDAAELRTLGEAGDDTRPMWDRAGASVGFDPATVQQIKVDDAGGVTFRAEPAEPSLDQAVADLGRAVDENTEPEPRYDLSEAAHEAMLGRLEKVADEFAARPGTLVFDLRDAILTQIKQMDMPFIKMPNGRQRDIATAVEQTSIDIVRRIAELMAAGGTDPIRVLLTKVTLGDDIVIAGKVKAFSPEETDAAVNQLHHARGKHVMLSPASIDDYRQGGREAETDPDEPEMQFSAGTDEEAG